MTQLVEKLFPAPRTLLGDASIMKLQPMDEAAWLWHPSLRRDEKAFLVFRLAFEASNEPLTIHVSADERYELFLDGERISRGPDRSDVEHWAYASYKLKLSPGRHEFKALVWSLLFEAAPVAQLSYRGGFALKAEGPYDSALTTGVAPWTVAKAGGWKTLPISAPGVFGVGSCFEWSGGMEPAEPELAPSVVRPAISDSKYGTAAPGWKLFPSILPERIDRLLKLGRPVAAGAGLPDQDFVFSSPFLASPRLKDWAALLRDGKPLRVPANTEEFVLIDLDDYYTGFPVLEVSGGKGSALSWSWAESLFLSLAPTFPKGDRSQVEGKRFVGMTDHFPLDGRPLSMSVPWWRAGRYWLLSVKSFSEPLEIKGLSLAEERYPLEMEGRFSADDPSLDAIQKICVRGMQACAHESYMDCPFYEQLMYVGDTRLEMLTNHVMTRDARLVKRCIELFDFSRVNWGFVNERYPSSQPQHSPTFSLIWTLMLHDFMLWRGADRGWLLARMAALRSMLEQFQPYLSADGLLEKLPGWPFMDWVAGWDTGNAPGSSGVSCAVNLLYSLALQRAADLEDMAGEPLLAKRHRQNAARASKSAVRLFWSKERSMLADELSKASFSEHVQALAILSESVSGAKLESCFNALLNSSELKLSKASSYFSFYVFEAFAKLGRADLIQPRLETWREMLRLGCKTPLEAPEPSRSDCHAWSSQPLFHLFSSIAGLRPASEGFKTVSVVPQPGAWRRISAAMPHPSGGEVKLEMTLKGSAYETEVFLPPGVKGTLLWKGKTTKLPSGSTKLSLDA